MLFAAFPGRDFNIIGRSVLHFEAFDKIQSHSRDQVIIAIIDDDITEPRESFTCTLQVGNVYNIRAICPSQVTIEICDDDGENGCSKWIALHSTETQLLYNGALQSWMYIGMKISMTSMKVIWLQELSLWQLLRLKWIKSKYWGFLNRFHMDIPTAFHLSLYLDQSFQVMCKKCIEEWDCSAHMLIILMALPILFFNKLWLLAL